MVTAMAADAWREVRERIARLMGRGDPRRESLQRALLDESQCRIRSAAPSGRELVSAHERARWAAALRLALVLDHDMALDLAIEMEDLVESFSILISDDSDGHRAPPAVSAGAAKKRILRVARITCQHDSIHAE